MSKSKDLKGYKKVAKMDHPFDWPPASVLAPGAHNGWQRKVVFDFHGVVVDWQKKFIDFVNQLYGYNIQLSQINFYNWKLDPAIPLTSMQFDEAFAVFARLSVGGYGDLEPYEGIKDAMEAIRKAGIGIEIFTWTPGAMERQFIGDRPFGSGVAQGVTKDLIRRLGLPVDADRDVRFMGTSEKIWRMVDDYIPLIVEDCLTTAIHVASAAHAAILVPHNYNVGINPNVYRLKKREDLASTVIGFFAKLEEAGVLL